jgi:transposase, IS5 family
MMVHFRKRFGLDEVGEINEMIIKVTSDRTVTDTDDDDDQTSGGATEGSEPPEQSYSTIDSQQDQQSTTERRNKGKQILDASCAPADIRYPTDLSILNEAREKTEEIIDALHRPDVDKTIKPRTYRRKARKDYLAVAKKKKPRRNAIRRAIGKQLRYLRRNLGHIKVLGTPERLPLLTWYEYRCLLVVNEVYRQQEEMYREGKNTIRNRIVSIRQPHVRPIVRGKVARPVEFGAKFSMSRVDDLVYLDRLSWEAYHEASDLPDQVERFYRRHGHYPESVHVDAIYRTRENIRYCRDRGIRISGPPLGRPKRDATERKQDRKQTRLDEIARIAIEGSFGVGKRRYTLDRILERRPDTSESMIAVILLVMNLETLLRRLFVSVFTISYGTFGRTRLAVSTLAAACRTFYRSYAWTV